MADNFDKVVKALLENNKSQAQTTDAVKKLNKTMSDHFTFLKRQRKDEEEARKKSKKGARKGKSGSNSDLGILGSFKDGVGFGSGFGIAGTLGKMAGAAGRLIRPIVMAGRLLLGPVGLTLMAAYVLFKNIAENENFKSTIAILSETWTKLKITFTDLMDAFKAAAETEGVKKLIEDVKNFIPNFIKQVQDLILDIIATTALSIDGVIDTFRALIEGDFTGAFDSIWNTIKGITDFLARTVDNIIQIFLPTTEDGFVSNKFLEVFNWTEKTFNNISNMLSEGITSIGDNIKSAWETVTNFFSVETISNSFNYVKDGIWNSLTDFTESLVSGFNDAFSLLTFENLVAGVLGVGKGLLDIIWDPINTIINWIGQKFDWIADDAPKFNLRETITDWVTDFFKWFTGFLPNISKVVSDLTASVTSMLPEWLKKSLGLAPPDADAEAIARAALEQKLISNILTADTNADGILTKKEFYASEDGMGLTGALAGLDALRGNELSTLDEILKGSRFDVIINNIDQSQTKMETAKGKTPMVSGDGMAATDSRYDKKYMGMMGFGVAPGQVF
jgi:hypothetical protein